MARRKRKPRKRRSAQRDLEIAPIPLYVPAPELCEPPVFVDASGLRVPDPYAELGLARVPEPDPEAIQSAYHRLLQQHPPEQEPELSLIHI